MICSISDIPTTAPTPPYPTRIPTPEPTSKPNAIPVISPTNAPYTSNPSKFPSKLPSISEPTSNLDPVFFRTRSPTVLPSKRPSKAPTTFIERHHLFPSTEHPTIDPTKLPSISNEYIDTTQDLDIDSLGLNNTLSLKLLQSNLSGPIDAFGVAIIIGAIVIIFIIILVLFKKYKEKCGLNKSDKSYDTITPGTHDASKDENKKRDELDIIDEESSNDNKSDVEILGDTMKMHKINTIASDDDSGDEKDLSNKGISLDTTLPMQRLSTDQSSTQSWFVQSVKL